MNWRKSLVQSWPAFWNEFHLSLCTHTHRIHNSFYSIEFYLVVYLLHLLFFHPKWNIIRIFDAKNNNDDRIGFNLFFFFSIKQYVEIFLHSVIDKSLNSVENLKSTFILTSYLLFRKKSRTKPEIYDRK